MAIQPVRSAQADINVTPLVDIVLVLLIIFMVATPLVERDLAVSLSAEKHTEKAAEIKVDQVIVALGSAGDLKVNGQPVARGEDFVANVRKRLAGRADADRVVFVIAEDRAPYRVMVEAIDGAKKAGAVTVGLPTETAY
jgi:biopolymer transport protein ExbD/biopolymer transport protein TolR